MNKAVAAELNLLHSLIDYNGLARWEQAGAPRLREMKRSAAPHQLLAAAGAW
jgi:hypothetical protein